MVSTSEGASRSRCRRKYERHAT